MERFKYEKKVYFIEAVLGNFQIRTSVVKYSNFGNSQIFLKIPVFCANAPVNSLLDTIFLLGPISPNGTLS